MRIPVVIFWFNIFLLTIGEQSWDYINYSCWLYFQFLIDSHNSFDHVLQGCSNEHWGNDMIVPVSVKQPCSLQWRHNERDRVSNHQPPDCLLNRLFRCRSKKTSKLRVTGHCVGNSQVTSEFPAQRASNAENVSTWWRHHVEDMGKISQYLTTTNHNTAQTWCMILGMPYTGTSIIVSVYECTPMPAVVDV